MAKLEGTSRWCSLVPRPAAVVLAASAFVASLVVVAWFVVAVTAVAALAAIASDRVGGRERPGADSGRDV